MTTAPAAASASAPGPEAIDVVLDAVTALKAQQKQLEQELEPLLETLSAAMDAGELDPSFSHNDWAFCHNPGRLNYEFPLAVQQIEQQLKAARDAAIQHCSATEKRGKPFWTIRPPQSSGPADLSPMPPWSAPPTPDPIEELRSAANAEDENGQPLYEPTNPARPIGHANPPRRPRGIATQRPPRPSRLEVERRIAEAQLWIAQRIPLVLIYEKGRESWGVNNSQTINRYLNLARERMVEELISDRKRHQAEQIYALMDCARRAADAEQFSAAVGAHRVIAEIAGMLRAPAKPYAERP